MANKHETLESLFKNIANAIRADKHVESQNSTGSNIKADLFPGYIESKCFGRYEWIGGIRLVGTTETTQDTYGYIINYITPQTDASGITIETEKDIDLIIVDIFVGNTVKTDIIVPGVCKLTLTEFLNSLGEHVASFNCVELQDGENIAVGFSDSSNSAIITIDSNREKVTYINTKKIKINSERASQGYMPVARISVLHRGTDNGK